MKSVLLFFLFIVFSVLQRDVVWAAEQITPGKSIDLLNDEYKEDDQPSESPVYDPLEPMNRVFFEFNDKLYFWVLKPVKTGYAAVVSEDIRQCIGNFFDNLSSPVSLLNNLLQGRFDDAGVVLSRFLINSTLGIYGFGDAASTAFDMKPRPADFGQTLGVYGFGDGVYFCWPVLGPSNIRDSVGFAADLFTNPTAFMDLEMSVRMTKYMGEKINLMSLSPDVYEDLKKLSLDPYVATRQAMFEFRLNQIEKQKR
jgi:phospholipid-binding lipoprotein MlaA